MAELQAEFGSMGKDLAQTVQTIVTSGGVVEKADDKPPILCLSEEIAIRFWLHSARAVLDEARGTEAHIDWQIVDGPHLDKWHTTVEDKNMTQRLAEKRYSVVATIGVSRRT